MVYYMAFNGAEGGLMYNGMVFSLLRKCRCTFSDDVLCCYYIFSDDVLCDSHTFSDDMEWFPFNGRYDYMVN